MFGQIEANICLDTRFSCPVQIHLFKPVEQTFAPKSPHSFFKPEKTTSPVCNSAPKCFLTESLKGGGMRSGVSVTSAALWDRVGDLTGLMIFLEEAEDEDNSFCKVAIPVPAMKTYPIQRGGTATAQSSDRRHQWFSCVNTAHRVSMRAQLNLQQG